MELILATYPRLRFYNTINEVWFSLLAPKFCSGTLLGSPSRPSKGQTGMAITLTAEGWGMAVTLTVTVEACCIVERCWWVLMNLFRNFCQGLSIHIAYWIQRNLRGARAFLKDAEWPNKATPSLRAVEAFPLTPVWTGLGLKSILLLPELSEQKLFTTKKVHYMSWNAICVIFLLKLSYAYKLVLLGMLTIVLSWPSWVSGCLFPDKAPYDLHCWYLYAKFLWQVCFTRHVHVHTENNEQQAPSH